MDTANLIEPPDETALEGYVHDLTKDMEQNAPNIIAEIWLDFDSRFLKEVDPSRVWAVDIEEYCLGEVIANAASDLERLKSYHLPDDFPDHFKYAAYLCYWLGRLRPVQARVADPMRNVDQDNENDTPNPIPPIMLFVNEYFAFWVFRAILGCAVPERFHYPFVYHLHYRHTDPRSLTLIGQCFGEIASLSDQVSSLNREVCDLRKLGDEMNDDQTISGRDIYYPNSSSIEDQ